MPSAADRPRRRFVLLDRDGVLNVEREYLSDPDQIELLPGVIEGLQGMRRLGLGLAVVTNQSGIGRGYFAWTALHAVHRRLREMLARADIALDGMYTCPHRPSDGCGCRKPQTGLVDRAAAELGFCRKESFVVGDKECDIELGHRIQATTFLVLTGYGRQTLATAAVLPDYQVENLSAAADRMAELLAKQSIPVLPRH